MTKKQAQAELDTAIKAHEVSKAELSKASTAYKKTKKAIDKAYKDHYEAKD